MALLVASQAGPRMVGIEAPKIPSVSCADITDLQGSDLDSGKAKDGEKEERPGGRARGLSNPARDEYLQSSHPVLLDPNIAKPRQTQLAGVENGPLIPQNGPILPKQASGPCLPALKQSSRCKEVLRCGVRCDHGDGFTLAKYDKNGLFFNAKLETTQPIKFDGEDMHWLLFKLNFMKAFSESHRIRAAKVDVKLTSLSPAIGSPNIANSPSGAKAEPSIRLVMPEADLVKVSDQEVTTGQKVTLGANAKGGPSDFNINVENTKGRKTTFEGRRIIHGVIKDRNHACWSLYEEPDSKSGIPQVVRLLLVVHCETGFDLRLTMSVRARHAFSFGLPRKLKPSELPPSYSVPALSEIIQADMSRKEQQIRAFTKHATALIDEAAKLDNAFDETIQDDRMKELIKKAAVKESRLAEWDVALERGTSRNFAWLHTKILGEPNEDKQMNNKVGDFEFLNNLSAQGMEAKNPKGEGRRKSQGAKNEAKNEAQSKHDLPEEAKASPKGQDAKTVAGTAPQPEARTRKDSLHSKPIDTPSAITSSQQEHSSPNPTLPTAPATSVEPQSDLRPLETSVQSRYSPPVKPELAGTSTGISELQPKTGDSSASRPEISIIRYNPLKPPQTGRQRRDRDESGSPPQTGRPHRDRDEPGSPPQTDRRRRDRDSRGREPRTIIVEERSHSRGRQRRNVEVESDSGYTTYSERSRSRGREPRTIIVQGRSHSRGRQRRNVEVEGDSGYTTYYGRSRSRGREPRTIIVQERSHSRGRQRRNVEVEGNSGYHTRNWADLESFRAVGPAYSVARMTAPMLRGG